MKKSAKSAKQKEEQSFMSNKNNNIDAVFYQ